MSIIGQMAREGFKQQVIKVIDKDIDFYQTKTRKDPRETESIIGVLKQLKKEIEQLDTA